MEEFIANFLQARDGKLTPEESYQLKKDIPYPEHASFCFVKPLGQVIVEDWYEVLLSAAMSGDRFAAIDFRYHSRNIDEARQLYMATRTLIVPLEDANIFRIWGLLYSLREGRYVVNLFPLRPEDLIPVDEGRTLLEDANFTRHTPQDDSVE